MLATNTFKKTIALNGYDPVSYFEIVQYVPSRGKKNIASIYGGITYYFRNSDNKALFDNSPESYLPQYGGYCATAVSEGATAPIDPHTFLIQDDRLYLFYNDMLGNNTLRDWNTNSSNRLRSADQLRQSGKVKYTGGGFVSSSLFLWFKNLFL